MQDVSAARYLSNLFSVSEILHANHTFCYIEFIDFSIIFLETLYAYQLFIFFK